MRKAIVFGDVPKEEKELKPIEIIRYVSIGGFLSDDCVKDFSGYPEELIVIKSDFYSSFFDCVAVSKSGQVYLCKFNDGVY